MTTGTNGHWRCTNCGQAFVVNSLLADHTAQHELNASNTD